MDPLDKRGEGVGRNSVPSVTVLRLALECVAAGDLTVPMGELRPHLSRIELNLARVRSRGGRYRSVQMSAYTTALYELARERRMAG